MTIAVITLDDEGSALARTLIENLPRYLEASSSVTEKRLSQGGALAEIFAEAFTTFEGIVCIMASGIVMRMLSPLIHSKYSDPAVVVLDNAARWAISLLSGHEGGANILAYAVAAASGAQSVITTASETKRKHVLGVGCRKGIARAAVAQALAELYKETGLQATDFRCAATIRLKEKETGLIEELAAQGIALLFIPEKQINEFDGPYARNGAAQRQLGVRAVAEPCALLVARNAVLTVEKRCSSGVTLAVAQEDV